MSCNTQLKMEFSVLFKMIENGKCKHVGKLNDEDIENIIVTLISSGLLTSKEIELYFEMR